MSVAHVEDSPSELSQHDTPRQSPAVPRRLRSKIWRWFYRGVLLLLAILMPVTAGLMILFPGHEASILIKQTSIRLWRQSIETARTYVGEEQTSQTQALRMGVVWGGRDLGYFVEGAELARRRINSSGGILGRPLEFEIAEDGGLNAPAENGTAIARDLAAQNGMIAVIGHTADKGAVMASIIYEREKILFVSPSVTDKSLTKHAFEHVFSTIPDNESIGQQIATFSEGLGLRRIGILNSREDWAFSTTNGFIKQAVTLGIEIPQRRSFFNIKTEFLDLIAEFTADDFDAILVVADEETTKRIMRQSMEMRVDTVFVLGRLFDETAMAESFHDSQTPIIMPILLNPGVQRQEVETFREEFEDVYDMAPDSWAAQGHDAVAMLSAAIEQARSVNSLSVATILRYTLSWRGLTGRHSFDRKGQIYTKQLEFVTLDDGKLLYSASVE